MRADECRAITKYAVAQGWLIRQPCEVCGEVKVEAHHPNYDLPFTIAWLCGSHHRDTHAGEQRRRTAHLDAKTDSPLLQAVLKTQRKLEQAKTDYANAIRAATQHHSCATIGRAAGVSRQRIHQIAREESTTRTMKEAIDTEAVREALADGVKAVEVAAILGVSRQRVYQIVHEEGEK